MDTVLDSNMLRLVRIFDAPRERVFDALARQDQYVQWICPPGVDVTVCEIDVRPGGAWRVGGYHDGGRAFASSGKYVEVRRPERLVFTWAHHADGDYAKPRGHETTVRIEFRALGDKTELTLIQGPFADTPSRDNHTAGWSGSFDKLEGFLGKAV